LVNNNTKQDRRGACDCYCYQNHATMSRSGYSNPQTGPVILVLYKIVNSESDGADDLYNCFQMPYGKGITLNTIKQ
jgi:hypothetical protein